MLLIFFVFNRKNQSKIVNNVVFVKLKRNFSQARNALRHVHRMYFVVTTCSIHLISHGGVGKVAPTLVK